MENNHFVNNYYDVILQQQQFFQQLYEKNASMFKDTHHLDFSNIDDMKNLQQSLLAMTKNWFQGFDYGANYNLASKLNTVVSDYQQNSIELLNKLSELAKDCIKILDLNFQQHKVSDEVNKNIYQIFNLFLDCCERLYQQILSKTEYQQLYAKYINDFIAHKASAQSDI